MPGTTEANQSCFDRRVFVLPSMPQGVVDGSHEVTAAESCRRIKNYCHRHRRRMVHAICFENFFPPHIYAHREALGHACSSSVQSEVNHVVVLGAANIDG